MSANPRPLPPLTERQIKRSASSTIAGYQYQFERSVVEVLGLSAGEKVRVEGIEDIDIWAESPSVVQVKYYQGQRWSPSSVRDAVHELLRSFAEGLHVTYVLYVHFGSGDVPPDCFSLEELKECLTYRPKKKPVERLYEEFEEKQLIEFTKYFKIIAGVSLDEQRKITTSAIAAALQCGEDEAEALHRMRAVQFLHEVAVHKEEGLRAVTRDDLLRLLGNREIFYNKWHKEAIGHERFIQATTKKLRAANFNTSRMYRGVLLEVTEENLVGVCRLAAELARDMSGTLRLRTTAAKPWTLILRGDEELVMSVKRSLIRESIAFNDGFEHLHFSPELFIEPAVVNGKGRTDRLFRSSHVIRVISEQSMTQVAQSGYQLAQLICLLETNDWHTGLSRVEPMKIHQVSVDELTEILKRVIT